MGVIRERARSYTQEQRLLEARHEGDLGNITLATIGLPFTAGATAISLGWSFPQASGASVAGWGLFKAREVTYTHAAFDEKLKHATGEERREMKRHRRNARLLRWSGNAIFVGGEAVAAGLTVAAAISAGLTIYPATVVAPWAYGVRGVFMNLENAQYKKGLKNEIASLPPRRAPFIFSQVR